MGNTEGNQLSPTHRQIDTLSGYNGRMKYKNPKLRYCLGKCSKATPHVNERLKDESIKVTCYNCGHTANAVA